MDVKLKLIGLVFCVSLASLLAGCATGNVTFTDESAMPELKKYTKVAIVVINDAGEKCPPEVPENLQGAAITQMKKEYPDEFEDVRPEPLGEADELLVEVHITKYKKGSAAARAIMIGLGSSKISTDLQLLDSPSKQLLTTGKLDLVWAVGGLVGASVDINDLVNQAGNKIATAIVEKSAAK